ncbi:methyltransferase domain-containing protein [Roseomonas sp. CCTCC AB2023176]|uniref:methyltransferase domain-containing protein n=1 Tax=Roseomonas sp. CCTCC AB2023176 TaxID=3342640 RepID=UPI0035D86636
MSAPTASLAAAAPLAPAALADAVAARYAGASRWARGFVRGKLRHDPATEAILSLARSRGALGEVLDLGCGRGQLALALLLAGGAAQVTGFDLNAAKVAEAEAASRGLPALFAAADLSTAELPEADTVMLVDVLYQMPEAAQFDLLRRVARAARRRVLIRAFDPDRGWRSAFAHAMERAGRAIRGDEAANRPVPVPALEAALREAGFTTSVTPCWRGTPLPNVLLVAERAS